MKQQEGTKTFHLNITFFDALRSLQYKFQESDLKIQFIPPNRIKVSNWDDSNPICKRFKTNFDKTLESVNIMKLSQSEKKIQRIRHMKKWKKQFQIVGLNILMVKKNYGNVYYLMGCASQFHLYQVLMNLQVHSYKTFTTSFVRFLYQPVIDALINSHDYQIFVYEKLKVTSTQMRIISIENQNKKKGKFIQLLFELEEYVTTKILVEKFKQILAQQYFACGLIFERQNIEKMKATLSQRKKLVWKIIQRKKQQILCAYVILKVASSRSTITEIMNQCQYVNHITFLKGIGSTNQLLKPLVGVSIGLELNQTQKFLVQNFQIKGNSDKNPNEISLKIKDDSGISWASSIQKLC